MVIDPAQDDKFMQLALAEARKGLGQTSPNPAVGAVIVKGGRILSRGYHHAAGKPHAEIEAIRALKNPNLARGTTIYVTLEPCSTHGRTPPCSKAIIQHGFARVVFGATDPNPAHAGRATRLLRDAGLAVTAGIRAPECTALNTAWNHWITTGRPYVIAKWGMSLDGRIGSHPESRWITSPASRQDAMLLRAQVDAILVGGETIRQDDPHLTLRLEKSATVLQQPWRIIWTKTGKLPATSHVFTDPHQDRTLVFQGKSLRQTLTELGERKITSVLIEGGGRTLGEAIDRKLVNRAVIYVAPQFLGGGTPAIGALGVSESGKGLKLSDVSFNQIESDIKIDGSILCITFYDA